jgi:hypothetical protein
MNDVNRDEFDRLVERVARVERTLGATVDLVASEVVGLRTYLDERFAGIDERLAGVDERLAGVDERLAGVDERFVGIDQRFDHQDNMLDAFAAEVQVEFDRQARALDAVRVEHGGKLDTLLAHFGLEPPS